MGGRLYRPHTTMIEGWEGQDVAPDRLWRVAIRERGDQTVAVRPILRTAFIGTVRAAEPPQAVAAKVEGR